MGKERVETGMSEPTGLAWPVKVGNEVYLNQYKAHEGVFNYWIDINGESVVLTKDQYIALYEARIQLWDEVVKRTEERIIKLLDIWDCNNDRCDCDSINECVYRQELIRLIKGETNS